MGNVPSVSEEYAAAIIIGTVLSGWLMLAIAGVLIWGWCSGWWRSIRPVNDEQEIDEAEESVIGRDNVQGKLRIGESFMERSNRYYTDISKKGRFWLFILAVTVVIVIKDLLMIITPSDLFQLRIGVTVPALFTRCNESLVDQGICAMTINAGFYTLAFFINAIAHTIYMKWTKTFSGIYVILTAGYRVFILAFVIFGMDDYYWTCFGFATAFAVACAGICFTSTIDSILSREEVPNTSGKSTARRSGLITGSYPEKPVQGRIMNVISRGIGTWEFWINIGVIVFEIFGYWTCWYIGTSGRMKIDTGSEVFFFLGLDIVVFYLWNPLKLWTWWNNSELEIAATGSKMRRNAPQTGRKQHPSIVSRSSGFSGQRSNEY